MKKDRCLIGSKHTSEFSIVKFQAEVQEKYMPTANAEPHYWVSNACLRPPWLVKSGSLFILASEH